MFDSWASGANPWGQEKEDHFSKPTHYDGMLEIIAVTGVVHLGQIQSGLRGAIRIAQGGHVSNDNNMRIIRTFIPIINTIHMSILCLVLSTCQKMGNQTLKLM